MAGSPFVTVLAWIFIVLSGLATFVALAQNIMIHVMFPVDPMQGTMGAIQGKQNIPAMIEFMSSHVHLLFGAFLALSILILASSIALLRRKNWARILFIVLMGFGIVWNIGGLFLQHAMFTSTFSSTQHSPSAFQAQFDTMVKTMIIVSSAITIGFSILFAWIIKMLVSEGVRMEFSGLT